MMLALPLVRGKLWGGPLLQTWSWHNPHNRDWPPEDILSRTWPCLDCRDAPWYFQRRIRGGGGGRRRIFWGLLIVRYAWRTHFLALHFIWLILLHISISWLIISAGNLVRRTLALLVWWFRWVCIAFIWFNILKRHGNLVRRTLALLVWWFRRVCLAFIWFNILKRQRWRWCATWRASSKVRQQPSIQLLLGRRGPTTTKTSWQSLLALQIGQMRLKLTQCAKLLGLRGCYITVLNGNVQLPRVRLVAGAPLVLQERQELEVAKAHTQPQRTPIEGQTAAKSKPLLEEKQCPRPNAALERWCNMFKSTLLL